MTTFRVEYLITVDPKDSFCNNIPSFNNLIKSLDGIEISNNNIEYGSQKFGYDVQTGEISKDRQRFFHLKLTCHAEEQLAKFEELLRMIRKVLSKASSSNKSAQVLWDDTSFYYSHKAYPLIHDIENTMRKLITKFMLINVGLGWTNETIPAEVVQSIHDKSRTTGENYLYEVDFIQLSTFLFKEYTTANTRNLIDRLRRAKEIQDLDLLDLQGLIPQSNWEKYFSKVVDWVVSLNAVGRYRDPRQQFPNRPQMVS